jgi:hypothetical protein
VWVDGVKVPYKHCMMGNRIMQWVGQIHGFEPFVRKKYSSFGAGDGADIRSELCNSLGIEISKLYIERWLRVNDTLELRFVNTKTNKIIRDAPIDKNSWGDKIRGIEFRAIDNMPPNQIDSLLHLLVLVAAAAISKCDKIQPDFDNNAAALSPHWHKALYDVRSLGTHAPVHNAYISKLASELGVSIKCSKDSTMFDALLALSESLHSSFKDSDVVKMMHPVSSKNGPPVFDNVGQMAWEEAWAAADNKVRKKVSNNPRNAPYIKHMRIQNHRDE